MRIEQIQCTLFGHKDNLSCSREHLLLTPTTRHEGGTLFCGTSYKGAGYKTEDKGSILRDVIYECSLNQFHRRDRMFS